MKEEVKAAFLQKIKDNLRVTKVVATRSVKGQRGDNFAGFAACYESTQDEPSGQGKDLMEMLDTDDGPTQGGMTLKEARVAFYMVSMQADVAAHEAALANGSLNAKQASDMIRAIRTNYGKLINRVLDGVGEDATIPVPTV